MSVVLAVQDDNGWFETRISVNLAGVNVANSKVMYAKISLQLLMSVRYHVFSKVSN